MFNVTIINAKRSITKIVIIISIIIILVMVTQMINKFKTSEILQMNISDELISCLNNEIPAIANTNYKSNNTIKEDNEEDEETFAGKILNIELARVSQMEQSLGEQSKDDNTQIEVDNTEKIQKTKMKIFNQCQQK